MNTITVLMIVVVPSTSALVDCRTACRTCRENTESPSAIEVYCAMCEECKLRRREKLRLRTDQGNENKSHDTANGSAQHKQKRTTKTHARHLASTHKKPVGPLIEPLQETENNDNPHAHETESPLSHSHQLDPPSYLDKPPEYLQDPAVVTEHPLGAYEQQPLNIYYPVSYPNGCPTPPACSESEEEYSPLPLKLKTEKITLPTTTTTKRTTTTTTTTTTPQPCPRIKNCKRKRRKPIVQYLPKPTPEIKYIRVPQPPIQYIPQPYPCLNPCSQPMLGAACPCPQYQPPLPIQLPPYLPFPPPVHSFHHSKTEQPSIQPLNLPDSSEAARRPSSMISTESKSTTRKFFYVYVGVPKKVAKS